MNAQYIIFNTSLEGIGYRKLAYYAITTKRIDFILFHIKVFIVQHCTLYNVFVYTGHAIDIDIASDGFAIVVLVQETGLNTIGRERNSV